MLKNKNHIKKYDILKNNSVIGFYLLEKIDEKTKKNEIYLTSNIVKEDIYNYYPLFAKDTIKNNYINYNDIENNIEFLINRRNKFKQDKELIINNLPIKDNIFNILMSQEIQGQMLGGSSYDTEKLLYYTLNNLLFNIKVTIDNLKKTKSIKKILRKIDLSSYLYGYVDIYNKQVVGIYLVKEVQNVIILNVIIDYMNNRQNVNNKLLRKKPFKNVIILFDPNKKLNLKKSNDDEDYKIDKSVTFDSIQKLLKIKFTISSLSDSETASDGAQFELERYKNEFLNRISNHLISNGENKSYVDQFINSLDFKLDKNSLIYTKQMPSGPLPSGPLSSGPSLINFFKSFI